MTSTVPPSPNYRCPICDGGAYRYLTCEYPACPDGRDQSCWRPAPSEEYSPDSGCLHVVAGFLAVALILLVLALATILTTGRAHAAKGYQPDSSPMVKWMESLMRPDMPPDYSCCGKADAYPVSSYFINPDGSYSAVIADGSAKVYPDGTVRPGITTGRTIVIPSGKVNAMEDNLDNPTEYSWVFLSMHDHSNPNGGYNVFCFVRQPTGG